MHSSIELAPSTIHLEQGYPQPDPGESDKDIFRLYGELDRRTEHLSNADKLKLAETVEFAYTAHEHFAKEPDKRRRKDGSHFITHPINVALILTELTDYFGHPVEVDLPVLQAALLHDVLEDTDITKSGDKDENRKMLIDHFGEEVVRLVDGVTDVARSDPQESEAESRKKKYKNLDIDAGGDPRIILLKLADRLHNMRTIQHLSERSQQKNARETIRVYVPLARHCGLHGFANELAQHSYRIVYPDLARTADEIYDERRALFFHHENQIASVIQEQAGDETLVDCDLVSYEGCVRKARKRESTINNPVSLVNIIVPSGNIESVRKKILQFHDAFGVVKQTVRQDGCCKVLIGDSVYAIRTPDNMAFHVTTVADLVRSDVGRNPLLRKATENMLIHNFNSFVIPIRNIQNVEEATDRILDPVIRVFTAAGHDRELSVPASGFVTGFDFAANIHSKLLLAADKIHINGQEVPLHQPLAPDDTIEIQKHPDDKWEVTEDKIRYTQSRHGLNILDEYISAIIAIGAHATSEEDVRLMSKHIQDIYFGDGKEGGLRDHGYDFDRIKNEAAQLEKMVHGRGVEELRSRFQIETDRVPEFNVTRAYNRMREQWQSGYSDLDDFLFHCAFRNVQESDMISYMNALKEYEESIELLSPIQVPDSHGAVKDVTIELDILGINISRIGTIQNAYGGDVAIIVTIDPSYLSKEEVEEHLLSKGFLLDRNFRSNQQLVERIQTEMHILIKQ